MFSGGEDEFLDRRASAWREATETHAAVDKDAVVAESRGIAQATAVRSRMGTGVSVIFEDGPAQSGAESPSASAAWDEERRRHEEAVHVAAADREASIHPQMQVIFATLRPVSAGTGH